MLYTFALRRSPLKAVPGASRTHSHYFGGPLSVATQLDSSRFARLLTLDLRDPLLSFLRFPQSTVELPLLMDFAEGYISYSLTEDGSITLHSPALSKGESLLEDQLAQHPAYLEDIPYEQYRAAVFRSAVIDDSFLSEADRSALLQLGEEFTQVGGELLRGSGYHPYCSNPMCSDCGILVTDSLASISQNPAPAIWLGFVPNDPAVEFSLCQSCHSISGTAVVE